MGLFSKFKERKEQKKLEKQQSNEVVDNEEVELEEIETEKTEEVETSPVKKVETIEEEKPEKPTRETENLPKETSLEKGYEVSKEKKQEEPKPKKKGFFSRIAEGLKKTKDALASKIAAIFTGGELDEEFYENLEEILITADVGYAATQTIINNLQKVSKTEKLKTAEDVKNKLRVIIEEILNEDLDETLKNPKMPLIIMAVGVNGVGKTTAIGRLANFYKNQGKEVILAAADTFRAAATEQLTEWSNRAGVKIIKQGEGADSASIVFDAIKSAKSKNADILIIDTAGRLHNNTNLMAELAKIGRVINREWPEATLQNLIVLDATTGQNAINQAEEFGKSVNLSGIILTKLDGTAKGGVVVNIKQKLNLPVLFIGIGEKIGDIEAFDPSSFAAGIL
jgi:fused signal recognition particle receptor